MRFKKEYKTQATRTRDSNLILIFYFLTKGTNQYEQMEPASILAAVCVVGHVSARVWGTYCEKILFPVRCSLREHISELKADAEQYNTPSTFAKYSLCERKVAVKQLELDELTYSSIRISLPTVVGVLLEFIIPIIICCYLSTYSVLNVTIPSEWNSLRPLSFGSELSFPELTILIIIAIRGVQKSLLSGR